MFRRVLFAAALLAVQFGPSMQAYACKGDKVLFEDDFTTPDPSWTGPKTFEVKGGKATLKAEPDKAVHYYYPGFAFEDADICVTITSTETTDPSKTAAGLIFWVKDYDNLFVVHLAPNGFYSSSRKIRGQWTTLIPNTKSDAIKQGNNQANVLRVTLKGQQVTITINDKEIIRVRGQSPEGPSFVGLYAASGPDKPDVWQFTNLKVTNVK